METLKKLFNDPQALAKLRHVLTFFCGVAVTLGFLTATQSQTLLTTIMDSVDAFSKLVAVLVTLSGIIGSIYSAKTAGNKAGLLESIKRVAFASRGPEALAPNAKMALVEATNALPDVKGVVTNNTPGGVSLAQSIPSSTVAMAGTTAALNLVKAA